MRKLVAVVLSALALVLSQVAGAGASINRIGATSPIYTSFMRGTAIAYGNGVYLVVSAPSNLDLVRGQFVTAAGVPIGSAFSISSTPGSYTHFPRVAFSPDANGGQGAFLVTWHESTTGPNSVMARLVGTSGFVSSPIAVGSGSWWEAGPAVAYATGSKEFLIVWRGRFGAGDDILGARVSNTGTLLGAVAVRESPTYEDNPSVAYNPATDEFMVVYSGYTTFAYVNAQRVKAGTGALLGAPTTVAVALGTYITDVAYNSATNQFVAAWFQGGTYGRLLNADGTGAGGVVPISLRFAANDALSVAYNVVSRTFLLVSHDNQSAEDGGVHLAASGQPLDGGLVLTASGGLGNFYPRVAANSAAPEWMLIAAREFGTAMSQRAGTAAGTGGTPPPPPPACAVEPGPGRNVNLTGAGQTGSIAVTASAADCAWTATSSSSWITITGGASGAGPGTVTYTVSRNTTGVPRTGTITITGGVVTVQQGVAVGNASLHDMTGDGGSDLMWHNLSTGRIAVWSLVGHTVTSTYYLTPGGVDTNWKVVGTGDLDGDGYADIVWQHAGGLVASWSLRAGQVASTQHLTRNGAPASELDPMWQIRAVGDLDADGKSDIIWQNMGVGTLRAWFMDGSVVRAVSSFNVGMPDWSWKIAGAGDINADGKANIIWQNDVTGGLGAWLMSGGLVMGQSSLSIEQVPDTAWKVRGVGDTNGDGYADLLWQNTSTGALAIWYLVQFDVAGTRWLSISGVADTNWHVVGPG